MNAAVLRSFGAPLVVEDRAEPVPRPGGVVVRVLGTGVCHTDLHVIEGAFEGTRLPLVLGHEIAGSVEGIGDVLVHGAWGCGDCSYCARGEEQLCARCVSPGFEADGGFAGSVAVPSEKYLVPLDGLDPTIAAPLADAGLTPYRAVRRVRGWIADEESARVIVIGAGGLGQFTIQYLKLLTTARVIAVDVDESKRTRAVDLGADQALTPDEDAAPADVVLDLVGTEETLAMASRIVQPGGIVMLVGEAGGSLGFGMRTFPWEAHLTTSIWGSRSDLDAVLELARTGSITWDVEALPLSRVNEALQRLRDGRVTGRLVLVP